MFFRLLLAFLLIPLAELYVLIEVGSRIGALNTVILVVLTAVTGAALARIQGAATLARIRASLAVGVTPAREMLDALMIFVAGLLLLTPGFLTDACGLLLLFPPTRALFRDWLEKRLQRLIESGHTRITFR